MKTAVMVIGLSVLIVALAVGFSALWAWGLWFVWNSVCVPIWDLTPLSFGSVWLLSAAFSFLVGMISRSKAW